MVKVGLLTVLCSLWWIVGLQIEGAFGVDVLKYTETVPSTSQTSNASEVIRGLGYWYFYGGDRLGPWTNSAVIYTQQLWLIALSFLVPALAFLAAVFVRWRHRAYFVLLVVVGLVLSVGAHPFDSPTPLGGALKQFMTDTTAGLAMRSTDRATPLVVIGLAMLLGVGVTALWRRAPWTGLVTAGVVAGLVVANNPAMFNGDAEVSSFFTQPASLPAYQTQAIAHLNTTHPGTRVLAIPGNDFAADRWGDTVDTPQAAFLDRPFVTREQQIMGSMATADTLYAMDDPIQEGIEDWNALAPMARLLSAGDVMVEYDQAYEHYGVPQPDDLARQLQTTPTGLSDRRSFGKPVPNVSAISTLDEEDLASPADSASPAPLNTYTVDDPRPVTRAESNTGAVIVAGDATGLQAMAGAGLLDTDSAIYYSGTLDPKPSQLRRLMAGGAGLVVTDTNRKQAFRWDTLTANYGATETPDSDPAKTDLSDSPIDLFSGAPSDARATAAYIGAADVTASSYGNSISYTPEDRAYNAIDNNDGHGLADRDLRRQPLRPVVAGQVHRTGDDRHGDPGPAGQRGRLALDHQGHPHLRRRLAGHRRPRPVVTHLGRAGHQLPRSAPFTRCASPSTPPVTTPRRRPPPPPWAWPRWRSRARRWSRSSKCPRTSCAGRAGVAGQPADPRDDPPAGLALPAPVGPRDHDLAGLHPPDAPAPSPSAGWPASRPWSPTTRSTGWSGAPGPPGPGSSPSPRAGCPATSTPGRPPRSTATRPRPGSRVGERRHQQGEWLQYDLPKPITFDHLNLQVVADGRHSVPTAITISTEQGSRSLALPPIADSRAPGATVTVPLNFPALSGDQVRLTVTGVRPEYTTNYYAEAPIALPLGIAEVGIPNVVIPPVPAKVPVACRSNLLAIDGHPVSVEITGSTRTALDNGDLSVKGCGPDANGIALAAGPHILQSVPGHDAANPKASQGWNLDQVVLDSAPGGGPAPVEPSGQLPATQPGPAPSVTVTHQGTVTQAMTVTGATAPFELVLGQSVNAGWRAVATPGPGAPAGARPVDLGPSQLVDGFANGWPVSAAQLATLGRDFTVEMTWTPQSEVWAALAISALAVACCLALAVLPRRWLAVVGIRRRRRPVATRERRGAHARRRAAPGGTAPAPAPAAVTRPRGARRRRPSAEPPTR